MEKIIWTKQMHHEFAKIEARHGFMIAGIVAAHVNENSHRMAIAWREGWDENQDIFFQKLASQYSPFVLFKTFLRSLGRRKSPQ